MFIEESWKILKFNGLLVIAIPVTVISEDPIKMLLKLGILALTWSSQLHYRLDYVKSTITKQGFKIIGIDIIGPRVYGFRVGVVKDLKPEVTMVNGERRSVAVAELALDKKVEPLARDTKVRVRPRSALGLKYIEIQPGTSKTTYESGDTIPVKQASEPLEFEDLFSTFDSKIIDLGFRARSVFLTPGDIETLVKAILRFAANLHWWQAMGRKARRHAGCRFLASPGATKVAQRAAVYRANSLTFPKPFVLGSRAESPPTPIDVHAAFPKCRDQSKRHRARGNRAQEVTDELDPILEPN